MKNVLITGKNSYIGTSLKNWLAIEPGKYKVDTISVRGNSWKNKDFSKYDTIVHVAGIAHQDTKASHEELYFKVNKDLTIEVATKAKKDGVKQFIFLSSMIVYGVSGKIGQEKMITMDTIPNPANFYGRSKLEAEEGIKLLQDAHFNVAVIRPPMIYGKGSKGNYPLLAKFAKVSPVFPNIKNKRSMLYIENLTQFIKLIITNNDFGIFCPQNEEYVSTSQMVKTIRQVYKKKMYLTPIFNFMLVRANSKVNVINKIFGDSCYDRKMSKYKQSYNIYSFEESIIKTEDSTIR